MSNQAELSVGTAIQDGWSAFRLAPWAFVGFVLLSSLLAQLANLIPLLGALLATLVNLWGGVGLIRGSWIALEGTAPRLKISPAGTGLLSGACSAGSWCLACCCCPLPWW